MMNKKLFLNKNFTSDGKPRAYVELRNIETLWFNTGTICNLKCNDCYIESSPTNKNLQYINLLEVKKKREFEMQVQLIHFQKGSASQF